MNYDSAENAKLRKMLETLRGELSEARRRLAPFVGSASYACGHLVKHRTDGHSIGCPICAEIYNAYKRAESAESERDALKGELVEARKNAALRRDLADAVERCRALGKVAEAADRFIRAWPEMASISPAADYLGKAVAALATDAAKDGGKP